MNKEILHMLGYLSPEQWEDAFNCNDKDLDKNKLRRIKQIVDRPF